MPSLVAGDERRRQVGARWLADGDRAGAGAAAAVRAGERLVGVVVHQVDAHVARPGDAEDGVHVGAVEVEQAAAVVQQLGDRADLRVEQAERVRVGHHEDGRLVAQLGLEVVEVDQAAAVALDRDRLEAGEMGRGGVGAVGAVGDQDLGPALAPVAEVGRGDQQRGQLALGAGRGLQADGVQAGDLRRASPGARRAAPASPGRCSRPGRGAARRSRAGPPAARSASGCTSSCTSRAGRNSRRSTC